MKLNTVIFDMDGLLIDSEPLWSEAATAVFNEYQITITPDQYATSMGLRTTEFVEYWFSYFNVPMNNVAEAGAKIEDRVMELVRTKGRVMPGVAHIFNFFREKKFRIGLASSSGSALIVQVMEQLDIAKHISAFTSAEALERGKPHPEVYLNCAKMLETEPAACVCFEDSFNGMIAAKAARMKCVIVPSSHEIKRPVWQAADLKISSLQNFNELLLYSL